MTRHAIGSYEWCEAGATLDLRDKMTMLRWVFQSQLTDLIERSGMVRARLQRGWARCSLEEVVWPDSRVAKEALEEARTTCHPTVFQHCLRTYVFGSLLAAAAEKTVDAELLFVGAILHDLGISPPHIEGACELCFGTIGARLAATFVAERGFSPERTRQTYEGVSLHFNAIIDDKVHGAEARFIGEGASLDVLGLRAQRLPPSLLAQVTEEYPRVGFRTEILRSNAYARHPAGSRPGFLGGPVFDALARRNPLEHIGCRGE
jgi:HD domain